jgi:hypothetical protein
MNESRKASAVCVVCGSATCRGVDQHGVFKAQLADSCGEIALSFDPIVMYGKVVGYCFLATCSNGMRETQIDSVLIEGDCGIA